MNLKDKKILITNYTIGNYSGSEINALSLGKALRKLGAQIEIATMNYAYPIRKEYEKEKFSVKNIFFDRLSRRHYDIIWAHHEMILSYLLLELDVTADRIIFSSLSPFDPYEAAPSYVNRLSLVLGNSDETVDTLLKAGTDRDKLMLFPNYVSEEFFEEGKKAAEHAGADRIAVVSNHIPEELMEAVKHLSESGKTVDIYGLGHREELVTAAKLKNYDAVITIGKTVQYAMALGIPVYCYDIHGGPGWLTPKYLKPAFSHNFSGRGFSGKTVEEIEAELNDAEGYRETLESAPVLRQFVSETCILEKNILTSVGRLENESELLSAETVFGEHRAAEEKRNALLVTLYRYNLLKEMNGIDLESKLDEATAAADRIRAVCEEKTRSLEAVQVENSALKAEAEEKKRSMKALEAENLFLKSLCEQNAHSIDVLSSENTSLIRLCEEKENTERTLLAERDALSREKTDLADLCDRKEDNCRYLIELNELKDKSIEELKSLNAELSFVNRQNSMQLESRAWKYIIRYRLFRDKMRGMLKKSKAAEEQREANENAPAEPVEEKKPDKKAALPLVTIGIPVYDRTDQLIECIESLLHQTYKNTEIIAVCDGSPKETLEIVKDYEKRGLIRAYYYKDNSGNAVRGRNKAIREARGVYYAFMDSDDIAEPDRISNSVAYLEKYNVDAVYGGWKALVDGSRSIEIENGQEVMSPDCDYEMLKNICVPCQSTVMAKTKVLRDVGGLKSCMRYREDHELWLRMAYAGYRFKSIDRILVRLRLHSGNLELTFTESDDQWFRLMQEEHKIIRPMKPKIAYVIPGCGISGGIAVICQHVNRLRARGYDTLLITETEDTEIGWFPNQMVDVVTVKDAPDNIDYLVATGWSTAYTVQKLAAKEKCYFVQSDETRFNPEGSEAYNLALESYKMDFRFFTEAKWIRRWLKERFGKEAAYVPNGLDEDIIFCTEDRGVDTERKVRVLLEGPIDIPYKGMKDAFEAVVGLDCEVWCISSAGTPRPEWKCDRFFTKVPMQEMKNIYSKCDILLKMSRVEGFFGPPMEMMACGGTCVVGKVTGYDEYIVDGYNALVVEQGDVLGAHNALKKLIDDPGFRKQLAENGKKTVQNWKWNDSIDMLEKVFADLKD